MHCVLCTVYCVYCVLYTVCIVYCVLCTVYCGRLTNARYWGLLASSSHAMPPTFYAWVPSVLGLSAIHLIMLSGTVGFILEASLNMVPV